MNKIKDLDYKQCQVITKIPKIINKANMMCNINKSLYHKYVYNKIKCHFLKLWELSQDDTFLMINKYIYLPFLKIYSGATDWCSTATDWWGNGSCNLLCWWGVVKWTCLGSDHEGWHKMNCNRVCWWGMTWNQLK